MTWTQTESPSFIARHAEADAEDVVGVLELLESTRGELAELLPAAPPAPVELVVHPSRGGLLAAQPQLLLATRLTAPAARRYLTGWPGAGTVHVLAPRLLRARASSVPGSREMAALAPAALYAQLAVGHVNARLPPPLRPRSLRGLGRWAWLAAGAGQWLGGQTAHARPAIARRLREGRLPAFPPGARDAVLLGGSVLDLLAREEGAAAALELACTAGRGAPATALCAAFRGRPTADTADAWRAHLAHLAGTG